MGNGVASGIGQNGVIVNSGTGNQILGNYIGTDVAGTAAIPNTAHGIGVFGTAAGTIIGGINAGEGNLISGNGVAPVFGSGIQLGTSGPSGSIVRGNLIGTMRPAPAAIPNRTGGIGITSNNNTIGGATAAARNVVSGNGIGAVFAPGVQIYLASLRQPGAGQLHRDRDHRDVSLPNNSSGVVVSDTANNNIIGGDVAGAGNVISGNGNNGQFGVGVQLNGGSANAVLGNLIGTNAAGTAAVPNLSGGLNFFNSSNNIIGGATPAARNVISGNGTATSDGDGVFVGNNSSGNQFLGNYIGVDITGAVALPNSSHGIGVFGTAVGTLIGGFNPGEGNVISGNGLGTFFAAGIAFGSGSSAAVVRGNLIGTNAAGTAAIPNRTGGITINSATTTSSAAPRRQRAT